MVGQAATSVEITREQEPDCSPGSTCRTSQGYGLSSGTWHRYYTAAPMAAIQVSLVRECYAQRGRADCSGRGCAAWGLAGFSRRVYGFNSDPAFKRRATEASRWAALESQLTSSIRVSSSRVRP